MSKPVETVRALVSAEYHVFQISDPEGPVAEDLDRSHTGLVMACGGSIEVQTGIHTGDVDLTIEAHQQAPEPATGDWEEIAEISLQFPSGELAVHPLMDDSVDLPSLAAAGPGSYRLRVHARGRDTAVDHTLVDDIVEWYLIQCWPAPHESPTLIKATDGYGADVRSQPATDMKVISHEDSARTQSGRERDILRRAARGDFT